MKRCKLAVLISLRANVQFVWSRRKRNLIKIKSLFDHLSLPCCHRSSRHGWMTQRATALWWWHLELESSIFPRTSLTNWPAPWPGCLSASSGGKVPTALSSAGHSCVWIMNHQTVTDVMNIHTYIKWICVWGDSRIVSPCTGRSIRKRGLALRLFEIGFLILFCAQQDENSKMT